jgi:hypothetical protein
MGLFLFTEAESHQQKHYYLRAKCASFLDSLQSSYFHFFYYVVIYLEKNL